MPPTYPDPVHVDEPDDSFSVVVEYQGKPDLLRLLTWIYETFGLDHILKHEFFLVVFYLLKGDRATFPYRYRKTWGGLVNGVEFTAVRLWECGGRIRSEGLEELAPLLVLCKETPTESTIREEIERIGRDPSEKQADLMAIAYLLGTRYFLHGALNELFGDELRMLKDAGIISDWIAEGEARGRQEGEIQGRAAEARRFRLRMLHRRFGELPASLVHRSKTPIRTDARR